MSETQKEVIGVSVNPSEVQLAKGITPEQRANLINPAPEVPEPRGKHIAVVDKPSLLGRLGMKLSGKSALPELTPMSTESELPATTKEADPELNARLDAVPTVADEQAEEADKARTKAITEGFEGTSDTDKDQAA